MATALHTHHITGFLVFRYEIMKSCWTISAEERPRFTSVLRQIEILISVETAKYYILLDEPYERFNIENAQLCISPSEELEQDGEK